MAKAGGKKCRGQAFHPPADYSDAAARGRRFVRLNAFTAVSFIVGGIAFQIIDRHRLIDEIAPALQFAGTGTNPADDRRKRIAFLDDLNGPVMISYRNLPNIFTDVDTGRTAPLAGCGAFIGRVFAHDTSGDGG